MASDGPVGPGLLHEELHAKRDAVTDTFRKRKGWIPIVIHQGGSEVVEVARVVLTAPKNRLGIPQRVERR